MRQMDWVVACGEAVSEEVLCLCNLIMPQFALTTKTCCQFAASLPVAASKLYNYTLCKVSDFQNGGVPVENCFPVGISATSLHHRKLSLDYRLVKIASYRTSLFDEFIPQRDGRTGMTRPSSLQSSSRPPIPNLLFFQT